MTVALWNGDHSQVFARELSAARKHARRSQRELALLSGVSHSTVARLERSHIGSGGSPIRPTVASLKALAHGVSTGQDGAVDETMATEVFRRFMVACGYGDVDDLGDITLSHAPERAMTDALVHVRISRTTADCEVIEVDVHGPDAAECGRLAREAFEAAMHRRDDDGRVVVE